MKLGDLRHGDKLVCLRIVDNTQFAHFNLKVRSIDKDYGDVSVITDNLDVYRFSRLPEHDINGLRVILIGRGFYDNDDNTELPDEFIFETVEDCKEFAEKYCKDKIKNYEEAIQTIETW